MNKNEEFNGSRILNFNESNSTFGNSMLGPPSFPAANSQQRLSVASSNDTRRESRTKVSLKPGRSLMDWIRLANSGKDLQGYRGMSFAVSADELAKHNTVDDCWMAIKGI